MRGKLGKLLCVALMFTFLAATLVLTGTAFAEERKALKITIDTSDADFSSTQYEGFGDDVYVGVLITPFTPTVTEDGLKNNVIADWWNGVGSNFSVEYEYYMPQPIAGAGDVVVKYGDGQGLFAATGVTDTDGNPAVGPTVSTDRLQNGWYKRTVVFGSAIPANEILHEIYFAFFMKKADIPESGTIDLYIRSIYMNHRNARYALYDDALSNAFLPNICSLSASRTVTSFWDLAKDWTGIDALSTDLDFGINFTEVTAPQPVSISLSGIPETWTQGQTYDLFDYAAVSNGQQPDVLVKLDGQDVAVADASVFVPQNAGTYTVTYTAANDENTAVKKFSIICSQATVPVIIQADVAAAVPSTGYAHQTVQLESVLATVLGQKNFPTVPEVKKGAADGSDMAVTQTSAGWSFTPDEKEDADYYVRYKAENEGAAVYSEWAVVTVTDIDKPVISGQGLVSSFTVSYRYNISEIIAGITVTDISDGEISGFDYEMFDPAGAKITQENFMAVMSGNYKVEVTAEDSDGNLVSKILNIPTIQTEGLVIKAAVQVAEENREAGTRKYMIAQLLDYSTGNQPMLVAGSKLYYEVRAYTVIDGQKVFIPGVGGISGQGNKGSEWKFFSQIYGQAADSEGLKMAPDTDLSQKLQQDGQAVWLKREYTVNTGDGLAGWLMYHLAMEIDTTAACGEFIYVEYKNIKVTSPDNTVRSLWSGTEDIKDGWARTSEYNVNVKGWQINAHIDGHPVYITGKIPAVSTIKQQISISRFLMKDVVKDEIIDDIVFTVTGPDGQPVDIQTQSSTYTFTPLQTGNYTVTVVGTNSEGSTSVTEIIRVRDNVFPQIIAKTLPAAAQSGTPYEAVFTVTDNATSAEQLVVSVKLYFNSSEISAVTERSGDDLTVRFTPEQEGDYRIVISAMDEAENEEVQSFNFTVGSGGGNGSGEKMTCQNSGSASLALVMLACAAGFVISRNKRA